MGYGRITKLVHAPRISSIVHQQVIHESYSPNKRAIEFQRQKLSSEFRDYFESIYQELIEKFRIRFISYFRIFEN